MLISILKKHSGSENAKKNVCSCNTRLKLGHWEFRQGLRPKQSIPFNSKEKYTRNTGSQKFKKFFCSCNTRLQLGYSDFRPLKIEKMHCSPYR